MDASSLSFRDGLKSVSLTGWYRVHGVPQCNRLLPEQFESPSHKNRHKHYLVAFLVDFLITTCLIVHTLYTRRLGPNFIRQIDFPAVFGVLLPSPSGGYAIGTATRTPHLLADTIERRPTSYAPRAYARPWFSPRTARRLFSFSPVTSMNAIGPPIRLCLLPVADAEYVA